MKAYLIVERFEDAGESSTEINLQTFSIEPPFHVPGRAFIKIDEARNFIEKQVQKKQEMDEYDDDKWEWDEDRIRYSTVLEWYEIYEITVEGN